MMKHFLLQCVCLWVTLQRGNRQPAVAHATERSCCKGDILLLLDSSGSVKNREFRRFLLFAADLLRPFPVGRGQVRVALLQVSTAAHMEFSLDVHNSQESLQKALLNVSHLQEDTNTPAALEVALQLLTERNVPKVLLWLTDGVDPGDVDQLMSELKAQGVSVLIVFTVYGDYQLFQRLVTPPLQSHLYSVDIESIDIIKEELRDAIIKIICVQWLSVVHLTSNSAVLQWCPVLSADSGCYKLWYYPMMKGNPMVRKILPGDSSTAELTNLQPETTYTAFLQPESICGQFCEQSVNFTTFPDVLSPAVVSLSESGPNQIRISWGPLQPARVLKYTLEFGAFPSGRVQTVTFDNQRTSALITGLEPGTQYLLTVSALHVDGKERAMSVRACTQEARPALGDLQLFSVERQLMEVEEVQAAWRAYEEGLEGYWVSWDTKNSQSYLAGYSLSSIYLPPVKTSVLLTHLAPNSRVCVSPVYRSGRGDGICCTAKTDFL